MQKLSLIYHLLWIKSYIRVYMTQIKFAANFFGSFRIRLDDIQFKVITRPRSMYINFSRRKTAEFIDAIRFFEI